MFSYKHCKSKCHTQTLKIRKLRFISTFKDSAIILCLADILKSQCIKSETSGGNIK